MVDAGHVETKQEAFDRYLAAGGPAYVEAGSLNPVQAVELIRESGGIPVLAHPGTLKLDDDALCEVVAEMTGAGLRGLEVYRPDHDLERREAYLALCERHALVPSGGSDFHRPDPLGPEPGDAGDVPLPLETLDRLFSA
jgi:predicted metal-dependent phosphoesterase TrpH